MADLSPIVHRRARRRFRYRESTRDKRAPGADDHGVSDHLTPLDSSFLELEEGDQASHMHVGWAMVFDRPPGGDPPSVDVVREQLDARLSLLPRFRRRLSQPQTGGLSWPSWIEDDSFDIASHVRHASLPAPGGDEEMLEWLGDFYSHRLDRAHPLWEMTLLDGLAGDRWAIAAKVHHCMIDGMSGASVTTLILDAEPDPEPGSNGLLGSFEAPPDNEHGVRWPLSVVTDGARAGADLALHPRKLGGMLSRSRGLVELIVRDEMRGAPQTSINVEIGAGRRMAQVAAPLGDLKEIKRSLGGTVNDVVLAVSAGGLRRLLESRGEEPHPRGMRAMVPVSVRGDSERVALGNRVSSLFVDLAVAEPEPLPRYRKTLDAAEQLKRGDQAAGGEALVELAGYAPPVLHAAVAQLSFTPRLFNVTITNVPGPQVPLYALGARLRRIIPLVPIFSYHAVGIAVASYDGEVVFGLSGDRGAVPDLDVLAAGIEESIGELLELARAG
jgi:diacylglycerol O-acyltransferase / wax synthase